MAINNCYGKEVALAASLCYYLPREDNCKSEANNGKRKKKDLFS